MKGPRTAAPAGNSKGNREKQARIEREGSALRENLRKRKEQARARAESRNRLSPKGGSDAKPAD